MKIGNSVDPVRLMVQLKGGISKYAKYGLTNVCHHPALSVGAFTAGTFALGNSIVKYRKCDVNTDEFIDLVT